MSRSKLGTVVLSLAFAGCVVNGKKLFGFGDSSGTAGSTTSSSTPSTGEVGEPTAAVASAGGNHPSVKAPSSYPWCKDVGDNVHGDLDRALGDDFEFGLTAIAGSLCHPRTDAEKDRRGEIEGRRQAWMKQLGMNEADWATDVVEWVNIDYGQRNTPVVELRKKAWSKLGPIGQYAMLADSYRNWGNGEASYVADALPLTEAGRLGYVAQCVHTPFPDDLEPVEWAVCLPDLEALDVTKLGAELRAASADSTGYERMTIRRGIAKLGEELPGFRARVAKIKGSDPAYGTIIELVVKARKAWDKAAPAHAELLALVAEMEDARITLSRKAMDGCEERTWKAFSTAVAKLGPKPFATLDRDNAQVQATNIIVSDVDGSLAARALVSCAPIAPLGDGASATPYRGPRTASITAINNAHLELDQLGDEISAGTAGAPIETYQRSDGEHRAGKVSAVAVDGDTVTITFARTSKTGRECVKSHQTDRVVQFTHDGRVFYEEVCDKYENKTYDTTPDSLAMPRKFAGGIERGTEVLVQFGSLIAVWKGDAAVNVFGVALK